MSYTVLYNLLNCPAGVVTVTKVIEEDIKRLDHHMGHYKDSWDKHVKNVCLQHLQDAYCNTNRQDTQTQENMLNSSLYQTILGCYCRNSCK